VTYLPTAPPGIENLGGIQAASKRQAALQDNIIMKPRFRVGQIKVDLAVVDFVIIQAALVQGLKEPFSSTLTWNINSDFIAAPAFSFM